MHASSSRGLVLLLLMATLSPLAVPTAMATQGSISSDETWSTPKVLTGDVIVERGSTLTISKGVTIDASTHRILVNGTLIGDGITISSTAPDVGPASSGAGRWTGFEVSQDGTLELSNSSILHAKTAFLIDGTANLSNVSVGTSYVGVDIHGAAHLDEVRCDGIDFECILARGTVTATDIEVSNTSTGFDVTGALDVSEATFERVGIGVRAAGATLDLTGMDFTNVSTGISVSGAIAGSGVAHVNATGMGLVLDAGDSTGMTLAHLDGQGDRLLNARGSDDLVIQHVRFNATGDAYDPAVLVRQDGSLSVSDLNLTTPGSGLAFSGDGQVELVDMTLDAGLLGVRASGAGTLWLNESTVDTASIGLRFEDLTTHLHNLTVAGEASSTRGIVLMAGIHTMHGVDVQRQYDAADGSSIGVESIWATVSGTDLTLRGFSTSVLSERSIIDLEELVAEDGATAGLDVRGGVVHVDELRTRVSANGAHVSENGLLRIGSWTSTFHSQPLRLATEAQAIIRTWAPGTTQGDHAVGAGELMYGSDQSITTTVAEVTVLEETPITITDLTGAGIQAQVLVLGFELTSASNGTISVPLATSGTLVVARSGGIGAQRSLQGGMTGGIIPVPVLPEGDWSIPADLAVVLGPKEDGTPHLLTGNLTLNTGAELRIIDTTLRMPTDSVLNISGSARIIGDAGRLEGGNLSLTDHLIPLQGVEDGLTITGIVDWACTGARSIEGIVFTGTLSLGDGCSVTLTDGASDGMTVLGSGAVLEVQTVLTATVLDQGTPVQGASIRVGWTMTEAGTTTVTNALGQAYHIIVAKRYTASGVTETGLVNVTMSLSSGLQQFLRWDSSRSLEHTFVASTVAPGNVDGWTVLTPRWSPYLLRGDLEIPSGSTLTVSDGVELRIASGATFRVAGVLDVGRATFASFGGGARWGGIVIDGDAQTRVVLDGSHIVEAASGIRILGSGALIASDAELARSDASSSLISALSPSGTARIELTSTHLHDAGTACIAIQGASVGLVARSSNTSACGTDAIWARQTSIELVDHTIGSGTSQGLTLADVSGTIRNLDASHHNGTRASLFLEEQNGGLVLEGLELNATGVTPGLDVLRSRNVDVTNVRVTGAPAVHYDASAGTLVNLTALGHGTGTGILVEHGRGSGAVHILESNVSGYGTGLATRGVTGESSNLPVHSNGTSWHATTALDVSVLGATLIGGQADGAIQVSGELGTSLDLFDVAFDRTRASASQTTGDRATLSAHRTHTIRTTLEGAPIAGEVTLSSNHSTWDWTLTGTGPDAILMVPYLSMGSDGTTPTSTYLDAAMLTVRAEGALTSTSTMLIGPNGPIVSIIDLEANAAPVPGILNPLDGSSAMETTVVRLIGTATDDDQGGNDLTFDWTIMDDDDVVMRFTGPDNNLTDLMSGTYTVVLSVTDALGARGTVQHRLTITLLDSDQDNGPTCDPTTWYDAENGRHCGPDLYDVDDDGDGVRDLLDAFPLDACAWEDTDRDGMPDEVTSDCPSTALTEDTDDDNDGILDGASSGGSDGGNAATAILLFMGVAGAIGIAVYNRMRSAP